MSSLNHAVPSSLLEAAEVEERLNAAIPWERLLDRELFMTVARGIPPAEARRAQAVLYERHGRYLLAVFRGRSLKLLRACSMSPEDLLQECFIKAFRLAASYQSGTELSPIEEQRRSRAWLGRIAERLLLDTLGKHGSETVELPDDLEDEAPPSSKPSPHKELFRQALEALPEREQDILRTTALYHRADLEQQRLPNDVSADLCAFWGISPANLRAIRKRAFDKIKSALGNTFSDGPTS